MKDKDKIQKITNKTIRAIIWFVVTMVALSFGFNQMSQPSDIRVGIGIMTILVWLWISVKTEAFLNLKFKRKKVHKLDE